MIAFALDAGDALIAAKAAVGHGRWLPWLKKECDLSSRQAERYMTLARGRKTLEASEANSTCVSNLTLAGALKRLGPPRSPPRSPSSDPKPPSPRKASGK